MNKIFKSLFTALTIFSFAAATFAASVSYVPTTVGTTSVVSSDAGAITSIQFSNTATNTATVGLFNAPTNVLTYVLGAYTNAVVTAGTTVTVFTNYYGWVQRQTNSTITTTLTPVAASTNNYINLLTYVIPASSTVNLPFSPALTFLNGLAITNSATNIVLNIQYIPIN